MTITNKCEAMEIARTLIRRHGLQWRADVPMDAWRQMAEANNFLSTDDRRECAGLPRMRS